MPPLPCGDGQYLPSGRGAGVPLFQEEGKFSDLARWRGASGISPMGHTLALRELGGARCAGWMARREATAAVWRRCARHPGRGFRQTSWCVCTAKLDSVDRMVARSARIEAKRDPSAAIPIELCTVTIYPSHNLIENRGWLVIILRLREIRSCNEQSTVRCDPDERPKVGVYPNEYQGSHAAPAAQIDSQR